MKIFELIIDELDKLTGVDAVALVETPAMEADFYAFKNENMEDLIIKEIIEKELFVDRLPGEAKESYIGRCIPVLKNEGYDEDQAAAICYDGLKAAFASKVVDGRNAWETKEEAEEEAILNGCEGTHEHVLDGVTYYMACESHEDTGLIEELSATKNDTKFKFAVVKDQQMVVGPLMIPNKLIFRIDEEGDPYHVYFSKETVYAIANKMMRDKYIDSVNLEHNPDDKVDGYMVSTWIVEDEMKDKQQVYGFNYPVGTWFGQYKIEDLAVWNKVKAGEIKGFSVEGFFADKFVQAKKQKSPGNNTETNPKI